MIETSQNNQNKTKQFSCQRGEERTRRRSCRRQERRPEETHRRWRAARSGVPLWPPAGLSIPPDCRPSSRKAAARVLAAGGSAATLWRCGCRPLGVVLRGGEGGPAAAASLSGLPPASRSLPAAVRRRGRWRPRPSRRGDRRPRSGGAAVGLSASSSVAGREGQPQRRPSPASRRPLAPSRLPSVVEGGGGPGPRGGGIGGHAPERRLLASRRRPPWRGGRASHSGVPLWPPAGLSIPPDCRPLSRKAAARVLAAGGSTATLWRCGCRPLGVVLRGGEGGPAAAASLSGLPPASRSLPTAVRR